jgi:hypothetical protein
MYMKHLLWIAGSVLVLGASCNNQSEQADHKTADTTTAQQFDSLLPPGFYKRFEGKVAGQPVVLHLQGSGNRIEGLYYYQSQGKWIGLHQLADSTNGDAIYLWEQEYNDLSNSERPETALQLQYNSGTLSGYWTRSGSRKPVSLRESYPDGSFQFTTFSTKDSAIAVPGNAESPMARISYWFAMAPGNSSEDRWYNDQIRRMLFGDAGSQDFYIAAAKAQRDYLEQYKKDLADMSPEERAAPFLNFEKADFAYIRYNNKGFVIVEHMNYSYEGGAHGNYGSLISCYDLVAKRKLTLRDIVKADTGTIRRLAEENLRQQAGLKPSDPLNNLLFENALTLTDNFYFTEKGIGLLYNPYEIASYAQGNIQIFIPFTQLQGKINEDFLHRLTAVAR